MRLGNQEPTFQLVTDYHHSQGAFFNERLKAWGVTLYPAQAYELELLFARSETGDVACKTICITKPRQNGKSYAARWYAIIMAMAGKKVLYTCHNGSTTRKMFGFISATAKRVPDIRKRLDPSVPFVRSAGNEGVYFAPNKSGKAGLIEFQTRTNSGALGQTYDVIVADEAQEIDYGQLEVIKPTTIASESGDPQMIFVGTPPSPKSAGDVFRDYHDQAHAGEIEGLWWLEWSATEVPADMSDTEAVLEMAYRCNPAMGYRIKESNMLDAIYRFRARPDSFARMYLDWWTPQASIKGVIEPHVWAEGLVERAPDGKTAFGVKLSADGTHGSVCAATLSPDGVPHVELIYDENVSAIGLSQVTDLIARNAKEVIYAAIDGRGNAETLIADLLARGCPPKAFGKVATHEAIAANAMLINAARERAITHLADPVLEDAATTSTRRNIGRGGGFGFDGEHSNVLEAAALAVWAVRTSKRNTEERPVLW